MIYKVLSFVAVIIFLYTCSSKKQKINTGKQQSAKIDFNKGSSPAAFSVKTIDGKVFLSATYKGKYCLVLFYNK
jgi:cytochrome oxidase Cu insertion factor (SCO1/SenC/PrrC family)